MTLYLKGNCAGECPRCEGEGRIALARNPMDPRRCPKCKGRGVIGKPVPQVLAETLAEGQQQEA